MRILTEKKSGGSIEIFIIKINERKAQCLLKSSDKKRMNKQYQTDIVNFKITDINDGSFVCVFDKNIDDLINNYGVLPLPPYIEDSPDKREFYKK